MSTGEDAQRYRVNVIPSEVKATLDVRTVPDEDAAAFLQQVKKVVNDPNVEDGPKGFGAHSDQERLYETELHRFVRFNYDLITDLALVRACDGVALVGQRLRALVGHADGEARRAPKERRKAGTCGAGAANRSPEPSIASP